MNSVWIDERGSEALTLTECLRLLNLGSGRLARMGLVESPDHVLIEPVTYRMLRQDVVVQVGAGSLLDAAAKHRIVFFEIDQLSEDRGHAWRVLVEGRAVVFPGQEKISGAGGREGAGGGAPPPSPPGTSLVRIRSGVLSGRRFPLRASA